MWYVCIVHTYIYITLIDDDDDDYETCIYFHVLIAFFFVKNAFRLRELIDIFQHEGGSFFFSDRNALVHNQNEIMYYIYYTTLEQFIKKCITYPNSIYLVYLIGIQYSQRINN